MLSGANDDKDYFPVADFKPELTNLSPVTKSDKQDSGLMVYNMSVSSSVEVDHHNSRYPHSVVWTPIPLLTWIFPFIGHMGICTTQGVIRDFAGPYFVSEDCMAFGRPTKYWQLELGKVCSVTNTRDTWDRAVFDASEEYKGRMHNLCCDNCHSHVAFALNAMKYNQSTSWNMINLCFGMLVYGKYVSFQAALKTWAPFLIIVGMVTVISVLCGVL